VVQVKNNKVMRVVPLENDARQRMLDLPTAIAFSYEALNSDGAPHRADAQAGWSHGKTVDWQTALGVCGQWFQADQD
jgi:NADH-quinone oxidoreductase subunit G